MDELHSTPSASAIPSGRVSHWRLLAALAISAVAVVIAVLGSATLSLVAYLACLLLATAFLVWHRWLNGMASRSPNYVVTRWAARLSVVAGVLIVVACALNALVWATEMAKI